MTKEIFKNLPNTTTPLGATFLNNLFDSGQALGKIVVDGISNKNLIGGWFAGGINSTDGSDSATTGSRKTDFISVDFSTSTNYKLSGLSISQCSMFVAAYNSNKQFLGRTSAYIQSSTTNLTLTASDFTNGTAQGTGNIKYLRVTLYSIQSGYTADGIIASSSIQLETGSSATNYVTSKQYGYISGSTENGNYIKYDDGTLIQYGETSLTTGSTVTQKGGVSVYASDNIEQNLPISFVDTNYSVTCQINGGYAELNFISTVLYSTKVRFVLASTKASYSRTIKWIVIGRWK